MLCNGNKYTLLYRSSDKTYNPNNYILTAKIYEDGPGMSELDSSYQIYKYGNRYYLEPSKGHCFSYYIHHSPYNSEEEFNEYKRLIVKLANIMEFSKITWIAMPNDVFYDCSTFIKFMNEYFRDTI